MKSLILCLMLIAFVRCETPTTKPASPSPTTQSSPRQESDAALGQEFTLMPGKQISIKPDAVKVRFESVKEDSRCPPDVACVWAGNAKISLRLSKAGEAEKIVELNTVEGYNPKEDGKFPAIGSYLKYKIRLVSLTRKPEYAARLVVISGS